MDHSYFFCPNVHCPNHTLGELPGDWFIRDGFHNTLAFGLVQRYKCKTCRKTFSDQTFKLNYWLKKKTDFMALGKAMNSSASDCFIGRHNRMSSDSIRLRHDRLARNAIFLQSYLLQSHLISEDLAVDGLESFVDSQYFPINLNILIGKESEFIYYLTESHSKRKGATTEKQKARMETIYADKSFEDKTLPTMFRKLLEYLKGRTANTEIRIDSDEHPIYASVINAWNEAPKEEGTPEILHYTTPGGAPRTQFNPLRAVNYFDRLIRKDCPNHRRETICFARNDRNMLSRFMYYMVTHNFFKPFRIKSRVMKKTEYHSTTVIEESEQIRVWKTRMHEYRFCQSFVALPEYFKAIWFKNTPTPFTDMPDRIPKFAAA